MKYEIYRSQFPDNTVYYGYTSVGIQKRWAGEHNADVQVRKESFPNTQPVCVSVCDSEDEARQIEASFISAESLPVLNKVRANNNSV